MWGCVTGRSIPASLMQNFSFANVQTVLEHSVAHPFMIRGCIRAHSGHHDFAGASVSGRVMVAHLYYARHSGEDCNSHDPLPVHLLDDQAADLQALGQLPLARSP